MGITLLDDAVAARGPGVHYCEPTLGVEGNVGAGPQSVMLEQHPHSQIERCPIISHAMQSCSMVFSFSSLINDLMPDRPHSSCCPIKAVVVHTLVQYSRHVHPSDLSAPASPEPHCCHHRCHLRPNRGCVSHPVARPARQVPPGVPRAPWRAAGLPGRGPRGPPDRLP